MAEEYDAYLKQMLAHIVGYKGHKGMKLGDTPAACLQCDVQNAQGHQTHAIRVLLVLGVQ